MDERFDFEGEPHKPPIPNPKLSIWDLFTALALLATCGIGLFFGYLLLNPTTRLNPLRPHPPTPFLFPTVTITPIQLDSTWTPTFVDATEMPTRVPTITLQPSATMISLIPPSKTPKPTSTPEAAFNSIVAYTASTNVYPDAGCAWLGIGGTVMDANNAPIVGKLLRLTGGLNGKVIDLWVASGSAPAYGPSGFEFQLGTTPMASNKLLTLQLLEQGGLLLANNVYIVTYNDCQKNLILVRFKKNQ